MNTDDLNKCLRSELASIETYKQAIEKNRQHYSQDASFQQLTRMLSDHEDAAARVRSLVQAHGGTPSTDSGAWGTWSNTVMGAAKLFGDKAALKALKEGEESGLKEYEALVQDSATPAEAKSTLAQLIDRQRQHITQLDRLIEVA
jgi:uncharacterized protein (TIGR02284 family)